MTNFYTGTPEQRRRRLVAKGLDCHGNNAGCLRPAALALDLADSADGVTPDPDAETRTVRSCGTHRRYFTETRRWVVLATRKLERREPSEGENQRSGEVRRQIEALIGRTFRADDGTVGVVKKARKVGNDVALLTADRRSFPLSRVELVASTEVKFSN